MIFILKQKEISIDLKPEFGIGFDLKHEELSEGMQNRLEDYILSLHGISEGSRGNYISQVRTFGRFLMNRGIKRFEDASSKDIDLFLQTCKKDSTKNVYIIRLKHFHNTFLKLPDVVEHLKMVNDDLTLITPSELLMPDEVVNLANNASKKRELYKIIVLVLFESCARISEVLSLRLGDVVFGSVVDKEGHRKLIATLHFKQDEAEAKQKFFEAMTKHNRNMVISLVLFLVAIVVGMSYLTSEGHVSGDALLFLVGTITGYVLMFIQRLVFTSRQVPSEEEEV